MAWHRRRSNPGVQGSAEGRRGYVIECLSPLTRLCARRRKWTDLTDGRSSAQGAAGFTTGRRRRGGRGRTTLFEPERRRGRRVGRGLGVHRDARERGAYLPAFRLSPRKLIVNVSALCRANACAMRQSEEKATQMVPHRTRQKKSLSRKNSASYPRWTP